MTGGTVPPTRVHAANGAPVHGDEAYVLYWMHAARRASWNFALERAASWARTLGKPLVVLETLSCGHPWASDRFHRFVLEGMADNARRFARKPAAYYPFVERAEGAAEALLGELAARACVVVTDEFPMAGPSRAVAAAARRFPVSLEAVDGNGLLPLRAAPQVYSTAYAFRRFLQKELPAHLAAFPEADPLAGGGILPAKPTLPRGLARRFPSGVEDLLREGLAELPIDHSVRPAAVRGGSRAGSAALGRFVRDRLPRYAEFRNQPQEDATSGLSPYLHFGHVSAHQVFAAVALHEGWSPSRLARSTTGSRSGWWGTSASAEAFLDQLVTWRELGFNMAHRRDDHARYESLPAWALATLGEHAADRRPVLYSREELEGARTRDPLWNAAQTQLVREGGIHNYLRMLWGKKILEWSEEPREALALMLALNDRYALDGSDPNSVGGIFWVLGRYDRPWGPERPVFGTVRYMSSENTARKVRVAEYVRRYAPEEV